MTSRRAKRFLEALFEGSLQVLKAGDEGRCRYQRTVNRITSAVNGRPLIGLFPPRTTV